MCRKRKKIFEKRCPEYFNDYQKAGRYLQARRIVCVMKMIHSFEILLQATHVPLSLLL